MFTATTVASVTTGGFDYTVADNGGTGNAHVTLGFVTTSASNNTVTVATLAGEFSFIDGMAGIDKLTGGAGRDTFYGGAGNDTLVGGAGIDTLFGGADNDKLDGGAGADLLFGGAGNDTYTVDDAGDVVREDTIAGVDDGGTVDMVQASVSYTLSAFVERLTLTGSAAIDGTGNDLANVITGNSGANHLYGLGGNDILMAAGNGADILDGGEGSDTYNVDNSDVVHDTGTTGTDTVIANGGYTLAAGSGIENLSIKAGTTNSATLTGDALANRLTGNDGDNTLRGLAGDDILQGRPRQRQAAGRAGARFADRRRGVGHLHLQCRRQPRDGLAGGLRHGGRLPDRVRPDRPRLHHRIGAGGLGLRRGHDRLERLRRGAERGHRRDGRRHALGGVRGGQHRRLAAVEHRQQPANTRPGRPPGRPEQPRRLRQDRSHVEPAPDAGSDNLLSSSGEANRPAGRRGCAFPGCARASDFLVHRLPPPDLRCI